MRLNARLLSAPHQGSTVSIKPIIILLFILYICYMERSLTAGCFFSTAEMVLQCGPDTCGQVNNSIFPLMGTNIMKTIGQEM